MSTAAETPPRWDWLDLRRPGIRDAVIVITLASLVFVGAVLFTGLRLAAVFTHADPAAQLNVVTGVLLVCCVVAVYFGCTRIRHVNEEVRARHLAEDRAAALARHDPMTGLANRRFFIERVDEALLAMRAEGGRAAVLAVEIDGFGPMNDLHGSRMADKLLIEFAARMSAIADVGSAWGRIGSDLFAVLQPKVQSLQDPMLFIRRLTAAAKQPFQVDSLTVTLGISIGLAVAPDDGKFGEVLVRRAELALRRAQAEGRGSVRFFEPDMDAHLQKRARIEEELRPAIAGGTIAVHYQPIVSLDDQHIVGFEALARWKSPKLGWVPPGLFVSVAEECGLMQELGDQLLRRACRDAANWPADLKLAFNVSPRQSRDAALGLRVLSIVADTGFDARRLQLEISDRSLLEDSDIVRQVTQELRHAGVQLAFGSFGTGYGNIAQLLKLRFDTIKISREIVHRLGKDADGTVIVRAMVALANSLGLRITAECIENREQLAELKAAGCREGQGFLFGMAVPPTEIPALLRRARRPERGTIKTGSSPGWRASTIAGST